MSGSLLDGFKAQRQQLLAEQTTEIAVPGYTGTSVRLRIHPIEHATLRRFMDRVTKAKGGPVRHHAELASAAGIIEAATDCVVIGEGDTAAEVALTSEDLLASLDLPVEPRPTTTEILKALCLGREGSLLMLSVRVQEHSGYATAGADEDLAGE